MVSTTPVVAPLVAASATTVAVVGGVLVVGGLLVVGTCALIDWMIPDSYERSSVPNTASPSVSNSASSSGSNTWSPTSYTGSPSSSMSRVDVNLAKAALRNYPDYIYEKGCTEFVRKLLGKTKQIGSVDWVQGAYIGTDYSTLQPGDIVGWPSPDGVTYGHVAVYVGERDMMFIDVNGPYNTKKKTGGKVRKLTSYGRGLYKMSYP